MNFSVQKVYQHKKNSICNKHCEILMILEKWRFDTNGAELPIFVSSASFLDEGDKWLFSVGVNIVNYI